jgi:PBP1b-binding outer membrane lipoprotein LpoB
MEAKYIKMTEQDKDIKKRAMFNQVFEDPEVRSIAKKFNHKKYIMMYEIVPDTLKLFESIKKRR